MKTIISALFILSAQLIFAQQNGGKNTGEKSLEPLTVKKIMRDPKWIGTQPSDPFWSLDSQTLYFKWNPEKAESDSLYAVTLQNHKPEKVAPEERREALARHRGAWNSDKTKRTYLKGHGIYVYDLSTDKTTKIIETAADISNPRFGVHDSAVIYQSGKNLYSRKLDSGTLTQLTNFKKGKAPGEAKTDKQEDFLKAGALRNSKVLRRRKKEKEAREENGKAESDKALQPIYTGDAKITDLSLSPDGRYVVYQLAKLPGNKGTIVPNYVTESGYAEDIASRSVVGVEQAHYENYIYDREQQTTEKIDVDQVTGIRDIPAFIEKDYPERYDSLKKNPPQRKVNFSSPIWNKKGDKAFVVGRAQDHKDRWIMALDTKSAELTTIDRQHDDAWIGGPGIGYGENPANFGWIDNKTMWYQSEKTGYSHLYAQNVNSNKTRALTSGEYEVQEAELSNNGQYFYITTNKTEPGQRQFYKLNINNKTQKRITQKEGGYRVSVSPDGRYLAELFSTTVHPWELYLQQNTKGAKAEKITDQAESKEYKSYDWQTPEITTFQDRDNLKVHAEVYEPEEQAPTKPGVIFVHGAGYLQDVTKLWGHYFREHMFMNMLVDKGYTVMNIDYRGSAGYGRDWRTAIYRHMGKNDLADIVDGAGYMVDNLNVNEDNIGIWGGSYGGFMTLMAMFKTDTFKSGGALRSVTDWAHYNHLYTSDILNLPQNDSIAYKRSSPINFADGLEGNLLMAHGMVDTNVHFQDIVRLNQKLIELGKENWNLAVYPVESHGFIEPSSWTDEYRRIFKLFERTLKD